MVNYFHYKNIHILFKILMEILKLIKFCAAGTRAPGSMVKGILLCSSQMCEIFFRKYSNKENDCILLYEIYSYKKIITLTNR